MKGVGACSSEGTAYRYTDKSHDDGNWSARFFPESAVLDPTLS